MKRVFSVGKIDDGDDFEFVVLCCVALDFSTIIYPSSGGKCSYSIRIKSIWRQRAENGSAESGKQGVGVRLGTTARSPRRCLRA